MTPASIGSLIGRPIGIDLFAGAGGMSLGFEQAGFDVAAAVEIDPIHAATHEYNFSQCAVLPRSVIGLTGATIRAAAGIGARRVDVVFGGAPCQGFSLIGHRILDDPRNALVREFVRIVAELDATCFVFENVKGLTLGQHRAFLNELIEAFDTAGYEVKLPWRVLDAACFGVPQHRSRLFLYGARKGSPIPDYPAETHRPMDSERPSPLPPGPDCRGALEGIPDADRFAALWDGDEVAVAPGLVPNAYAREMRGLSNESWHFGHLRAWNPGLLTASARTAHSAISRRRFAATEAGRIEPISRFFKLRGEGLSNTLRAGTDSARGAFTSPRPIHFEFPRCVTVREMARLHGFPDWFRFHTTKWHGARQIGNAVPPPLARAVAGAVLVALGIAPVRPGGVSPLGDPSLLRMDMSEACAYFKIENPIRGRDRKSGAKKRRQVDIEAAMS